MCRYDRFRIIKRFVPTEWEMEFGCQGEFQPVPKAFSPIYIVAVLGLFRWHDIKAFKTIRAAAEFRNLLMQPHHGEI